MHKMIDNYDDGEDERHLIFFTNHQVRMCACARVCFVAFIQATPFKTIDNIPLILSSTHTHARARTCVHTHTHAHNHTHTHTCSQPHTLSLSLSHTRTHLGYAFQKDRQHSDDIISLQFPKAQARHFLDALQVAFDSESCLL
jgi:hypothetical protein